MGLRTPRGSRQHVGRLVRMKMLFVRVTLARAMRSDKWEGEERERRESASEEGVVDWSLTSGGDHRR